MKNIFSLVFIIIALLTPAFSDDSEKSQVLVPRKVFVGDTAELRYSFHSPVDFFSDVDAGTDTRMLNLKALPFPSETSDYTLLGASLKRKDLNYTLIFTFIPWRTGEIKFPPFDLASVIYNIPGYQINTSPVTIASILQSSDGSTLRPPAAPLLVPGTMYAVYGIAVAFVLFFILIVRILLHWSAIRSRFNNYRIRRHYAKNAKTALHMLKKLEKRKNDDITFCCSIQQILRKYLDTRYDYPFSAVVSKSLVDVFDTLTAGVLSSEKYENMESLAAIFRRADYIRFSHEEELGKNERSDLITSARSVIKKFEEVSADA